MGLDRLWKPNAAQGKQGPTSVPVNNVVRTLLKSPVRRSTTSANLVQSEPQDKAEAKK